MHTSYWSPKPTAVFLEVSLSERYYCMEQLAIRNKFQVIFIVIFRQALLNKDPSKFMKCNNIVKLTMVYT